MIFNMVQVNSVWRDLRRTAHMMQLGVDPYKVDSIIGCRIVYVIFLIIVKKKMVSLIFQKNFFPKILN